MPRVRSNRAVKRVDYGCSEPRKSLPPGRFGRIDQPHDGPRARTVSYAIVCAPRVDGVDVAEVGTVRDIV